MEIIKARERKQKLTKCIYSLDKKCCLNEETKGNDAREKKKHKMLKKKPLLQQTFLLCLYLEKQPFLLLLFHNVFHLRTTERRNTSVLHLTEWLREEHHFSPLVRDKGAALSCQLCLLHPK